MRNAGIVAIAVLVSAGPLVAQVAQTPQAPPAGSRRVIQRVLVKVNGEVFTQTEYERELILALQERKRSVVDPRALQEDASLRALVSELTPDILVDAVDQLLLVQHGRELGFRLSDEQFKVMTDRVKAENKLDDAQLRAALAEQGLSFETWRDIAEQQKIKQDVQSEEIMQKASVTDEEKRQYYAAHPDEFKTPATITLREIVLLVASQVQSGSTVVNAAVEEAARVKAAAIHDRIKKGEDFTALAGELSESATKANGGVLGSFNLADLDPSLRAIVDKMKVGDVTDPLRTPRGYQLLKLDAMTTPELQPLDKVKDEIAQKIYMQRMEAETRKFLTRIRTLALIEWKDDALKQVYDKRLAERIAAAR
jgi:parvulin-like peptidyl-prolyl isomerase